MNLVKTRVMVSKIWQINIKYLWHLWQKFNGKCSIIVETGYMEDVQRLKGLQIDLQQILNVGNANGITTT